MTVGATQIVIVAISEIAASFIICRLWSKRRPRSITFRIFWSLILLIPLLGPVLYFFITETPDEHPYDTDMMRGAAEAYDDSGAHH
jgi:hypothetical protein